MLTNFVVKYKRSMTMNSIIKILNILRLSSFILLIIVSIPLTINYFSRAGSPEFLVQAHVVTGILFIVFDTVSNILQKKYNNYANRTPERDS